MDFFARNLTIVYNLLVKIPKFVLLTLSGTLASFMLSFLHRGSKKEDEKVKKQLEEAKDKPSASESKAKGAALPSSSTSKASATSTHQSSPKKRKGKK